MTGHKIVVDNPVGVEKSLVKTAKRAIKAVLSDRGVALPCRVELVFADKEDIRALNLEKRGIDAVTDVLSFPMLDLQPGRDIGAAAGENDFFRGRLDLGSIVICAARAYEQAKEYGHSQARSLPFWPRIRRSTCLAMTTGRTARRCLCCRKGYLRVWG